MIKAFIYLYCCLALFALENNKMSRSKIISYLPLGDSYTICTGAPENESWPVLLTQHLNENKIPCKLLDNPARNGFSTQELIDEELPLVKKLQPDFVSVLIGVNDWVRGATKSSFSKNLHYILDELEKNIPDRKKILLITIPDFGVTPSGKNYARGRNISEGILEFNAIIKEEAKKRKLVVVDLFEISQKMGSDNSLIAKDGLHPSAKEYAVWESMLLPEAIKLLK
jgi:acyl-CoA thioesterase-1